MFVDRVDNHKVAKTEVVHNGIAKVDGQLFGIFIYKNSTELADRTCICHFRRFNDNRQIGIVFSEIAGKSQTCVSIFHSLALKRHIADYAEHLLAVFLIQLHGLFVVTGEHHFRTATHAQHLLVLVEGFCREKLRLLEQKFIDMRKHRRVKAY